MNANTTQPHKRCHSTDDTQKKSRSFNPSMLGFEF